MTEDSPSGERSNNLHAPWRLEYIRLLAGDQKGCFICRALEQTEREEDNLLLWRSAHCVVVMNMFPYTGGHLLVAPRKHVGELAGIPTEALCEMMELTADCTSLLQATIQAEGFNIGMNIGRCAGAGLPDHAHLHIVPRWSGDTNFMSVLGDVRVIPQSMRELRRDLLAKARQLGLPRCLRPACP